MTEFSNTKQTKICDDGFTTFQEDVLGLQVPMYYVFSMEVTHPLKQQWTLFYKMSTALTYTSTAYSEQFHI